MPVTSSVRLTGMLVLVQPRWAPAAAQKATPAKARTAASMRKTFLLIHSRIARIIEPLAAEFKSDFFRFDTSLKIVHEEPRNMTQYPRSAYDQVGGIVYFARMMDKIRLFAAGELPADYYPNLGKGFDGRCTRFLKVDYAALRQRVLQGGTDEEILEWCFANGRRPGEEDILAWNSFMRKRGWRDEERITRELEDYKAKSGLAERTDILTFFDYYEVDEHRKP